MGLLNMFGKSKEKKEGFEFPEKEDLDIPPAPPSVTEEPTELPSFPVKEEKVEVPEISPVDEAEDEAVQIVKEGLEERESLELAKPLYIKYKMYKAMLDEVSQIKIILKESEDTLTRLADFKDDEDKEFAKWRRELDDIQRKLIYADKVLFGK